MYSPGFALYTGSVTLSSAGLSGTCLRSNSVHNASSLALRSVPVAVSGKRVLASYVQTQPQTYNVTVVHGNKCTTIDVDRDTNLRAALLDAEIDLYTLRGKMFNCGGIGQCGTCLISAPDGFYKFSERSEREEILLKNKPDNYRLACHTFIDGDVTVAVKPGQ